jgi:hypothetical protein
MTTAHALHIYKNLLKLAGRLPVDKKSAALQQIRTAFRQNAQEMNVEKINELLLKAQSSISYLKMVTPKSTLNQGGVTRIVFGEGKDNNGIPTKAVTNWTGKNLDPDSVKRHYQSLKRAGFRDNRHAKGVF